MSEQAAQTDERLASQWVRADQLFPDLEIEARQKSAELLGTVSVAQTVTVESVREPNNPTTLMTAIQLAALGDQQSRKQVERNVAMDLAERWYKSAHQTENILDIVDNQLFQDGRPIVDITANTLKYAVLNTTMFRRASHEHKNSFLFNELLPTGILDTHDAVVFSPATKDKQTRRDFGFFEDTDTMSIQMLIKNGQQVTLQTALVAGKISKEAASHDIEAITRLAARHKIDLHADSVDDLLRYVILVPKDATPNGVTDIVRMYDDVLGGTFYGEAKPRQDYLEHARICRERDFSAMTTKITEQLIREAHAFSRPLDAIERLDYLSDRMSVDYAVSQRDIDIRIFGPQAAGYIEQARDMIEQGDMVGAERAVNRAKETSQSSSCPVFRGAERGGDSSDGAGEEKSEKKWMKCPHCNAKVFDDPCSNFLSCWDCKAKVINGVTFKGNGGSAKRRAEAEKKRQQEQAKPPKEPAIVAVKGIERARAENRQYALAG